MSQSEIDDVVAAVEALVRRAYALGRRDGLRHLVKYAQTDEALAKPLALLAPAAEASALHEETPMRTANDAGGPIIVPDETAPPPRKTTAPASGGLGAMILDFVYPPRAS